MDERLRSLARRAAAGDAVASEQLIRESTRAGLTPLSLRLGQVDPDLTRRLVFGEEETHHWLQATQWMGKTCDRSPDHAGRVLKVTYDLVQAVELTLAKNKATSPTKPIAELRLSVGWDARMYRRSMVEKGGPGFPYVMWTYLILCRATSAHPWRVGEIYEFDPTQAFWGRSNTLLDQRGFLPSMNISDDVHEEIHEVLDLDQRKWDDEVCGYSPSPDERVNTEETDE